ncbi:MAG: hypothetical protein RSC76_05385 [Oscillospiraceae bacterium]
MNKTAELLNFVFQNSQMGVTTTEQLLGIVQDDRFLKQLHHEYDEYKKMNDTARAALNEHGFDEEGITGFEKITTYLMINMQTLLNKTPSHIAEMMITGSNMGIIDATKKLREFADAKPEAIALMDTLLEMEERNTKDLKKFL